MQEHERIAQKLDTLYARRAFIDSEQTFIVAQLANYACILISAYLERALVEVASDFCQKRATPQVSSFVNAQISWFQNPRAERVEKLILGFGEPIRSSFAQEFTDEVQAAINSVVSNRNNLAHGRNATVTFHMLIEWDKKIRDFVNALKQKILI